MMQAKKEIRDVLVKASGVNLSLDDVRDSPYADYGVPIGFKLAEEMKRSPQEIALEIAGKIAPGGLIKEASAKQGYVNFNLDYGAFTRKLLEEFIQNPDSYGRAVSPPSGKIILEHTSVNPSGPIHVGRLRNTVIGDSLRRILKFYGHNVETHYYVNDIGKQIAIIAKGIEDGLEQDMDAAGKYAHFGHKKDFRVFFTYVTANRLYEEDEAFKKSVDEMILAAENGDAREMQKITRAAEKALEGQLETFARLGAKFDFFDFESSDLKEGRVQNALRRIKNSDIYVEGEIGAGVDLSRWGIEKKGGFTVLERPDGTSVYSARDVAYHLEKIKLGDRLINVLGEDHKLQARELALILEHVFNVDTPIDVVHFSFVSFEGKQFSTRRGEIASVDMLLDEAEEKAHQEIEERGIGDPGDAGLIGIGAVKFGIVKTVPAKPITFNWGEALSFDGESAPYVQYSHARSCRILDKAGVETASMNVQDAGFNLENREEKELVKALSEFPRQVEAAVKELRPDLIAHYLLKLSSAYGRFYMKCPVLDSGEKTRNRRLVLVWMTAHVIKTGLGVIGVEAPERM